MILSELENTRIKGTVTGIPQDIGSILELGCGDGRIAYAMDNKIPMTGIDLDKKRIRSFPGNKITANIAALPIQDEAFDLVLSTEVLEHLSDELLAEARREIMRVARKYILITVPYNEILSAEWVKCSGCGSVFHPWGHVRTFGFRILKNLFDPIPLVEVKFLGPMEAKIPSFIYFMARKLGNVWGANKETVCPKCGANCMESAGNILGKILIRLIWRTLRVSPFKKPIWIRCLYKVT